MYGDYIRRRIASEQKVLTASGEVCKIKSSGKPLRDYRIYGNTVDGVSVGDETANICNGVVASDQYRVRTEQLAPNIIKSTSTGGSGYSQIKVHLSAGSYVLATKVDKPDPETWPSNIVIWRAPSGGDSQKVRSMYPVGEFNFVTFNISTEQDYYIGLYPNAAQGTPVTFYLHIQRGTTFTGYEPYGYKIPIAVSREGQEAQEYKILLSEPLRKSGNAVDYIDFKNQKIVRNVSNDGTPLINPTTQDIELPEIPTYRGINWISVATSVPPSKFIIKYK